MREFFAEIKLNDYNQHDYHPVFNEDNPNQLKTLMGKGLDIHVEEIDLTINLDHHNKVDPNVLYVWGFTDDNHILKFRNRFYKWPLEVETKQVPNDYWERVEPSTIPSIYCCDGVPGSLRLDTETLGFLGFNQVAQNAHLVYRSINPINVKLKTIVDGVRFDPETQCIYANLAIGRRFELVMGEHSKLFTVTLEGIRLCSEAEENHFYNYLTMERMIIYIPHSTQNLDE